MNLEIEDYYRYSDEPLKQPVNILFFLNKIEPIVIPSHLEPESSNELQLFLVVESESMKTNILRTRAERFNKIPEELVLNTPIIAEVDDSDQLVIQLHAKTGALSAMLAKFTIEVLPSENLSFADFLSGKGVMYTIKNNSQVLEFSCCSHQLLYLQSNTFYNANSPPSMFVYQGFYQFTINNENHYLNATLFNRCQIFPGYILKLLSLQGSILYQGENIGLPGMQTLLKQKITQKLSPAVAARYDVFIDENAVTTNIDKLMLLITAHTGVFPIVSKYVAISKAPNADFQLQESEEFKFEQAAYLEFELICEVEPFFSAAASESIDEPFAEPFNCCVLQGVWKRGEELKFELSNHNCLHNQKVLEIDDLSCDITISLEELGFREFNEEGLIPTTEEPEAGYFGEEVQSLDIRYEEPLEIQSEQDKEEAKEIIGEVTDSQKYPVNIKLRLYKLVEMVDQFFCSRDKIKFRMIGTTSENESEVIDSKVLQIDFSEMQVLEFENNFYGCISDVCIELLKCYNNEYAVVGEQTMKYDNSKQLADGFSEFRVEKEFDYTEEFKNQDFFDMILEENRCDNYYDFESPEMAYVECEFSFVFNDVAGYEEYEDIKQVERISQLYWSKMSTEREEDVITEYEAKINEQFYTPERELLISNGNKNKIVRHYVFEANRTMNIDILSGLSLLDSGLYNLSLIYPNPLVLQAENFEFNFINSTQEFCYTLENAKLEDLRLKIMIGEKDCKVYKLIFALEFNTAEAINVHCYFHYCPEEAYLRNVYYLALPFNRSCSRNIYFEETDRLVLASPNTSGTFLPALQSEKEETSEYNLSELPISINLSYPGVDFSFMKETHIQISRISSKNCCFLYFELNSKEMQEFGKGQSYFLLSNKKQNFVLIVDYLPYCELKINAGAMIKLPLFNNTHLCTYPPSSQQKLRCLESGEELVLCNGDINAFIVQLEVEESKSVLKKYFVKSKPGEIKQIIYNKGGVNIKASSEYYSILRVKQCKICDEGWAIIVELGECESGFRSQCRIYIENSEVIDCIILEVLFE